MNFASGKVEESGGGYSFKLGEQTVKLDDKVLSERPDLKNYTGKEIIIGIRPQDFEAAELASDAPADSRLRVKADLVEAIGTETLIHFVMDAPIALTEDMKELAQDAGTDVKTLEERAKEGKNEFVATVDPRAKIKEGSETELVLDTTRLHFFDPENSKGIQGNGR